MRKGALPQGEGLFFFLPHPSSPARRGSTSLLNPPLLRRWGLKAWPAGPVLASKLTPLKGLLVVVLRNRFAIVLRNRIAIVWRTMCECFTHDVRVFVRRGRGCASFWLLIADEKNGEKFGGVGNNTYLCSVNTIKWLMSDFDIKRKAFLQCLLWDYYQQLLLHIQVIEY